MRSKIQSKESIKEINNFKLDILNIDYYHSIVYHLINKTVVK